MYSLFNLINGFSRGKVQFLNPGKRMSALAGRYAKCINTPSQPTLNVAGLGIQCRRITTKIENQKSVSCKSVERISHSKLAS